MAADLLQTLAHVRADRDYLFQLLRDLDRIAERYLRLPFDAEAKEELDRRLRALHAYVTEQNQPERRETAGL